MKHRGHGLKKAHINCWFMTGHKLQFPALISDAVQAAQLPRPPHSYFLPRYGHSTSCTGTYCWHWTRNVELSNMNIIPRDTGLHLADCMTHLLHLELINPELAMICIQYF